ncbi:hypothetical protein KIN20_030644 [Parelaphostrongylus tenuis]|uniref:Uncharacterized protein n=1 Tax=Parelaphostrongylus tenuis TaxID=148309 RepID=A0AAD5WGM6_PARTN|nr:hypothetical protein KIN20_030644 [Parelaphostrongylus tenuis]
MDQTKCKVDRHENTPDPVRLKVFTPIASAIFVSADVLQITALKKATKPKHRPSPSRVLSVYLHRIRTST